MTQSEKAGRVFSAMAALRDEREREGRRSEAAALHRAILPERDGGISVDTAARLHDMLTELERAR